jgi:predicted alpha/beta-hydrolase family hydrolase
MNGPEVIPMPEPIYLDLVAEDGNPLRHKYFQQEGQPAGLVITFPGDHYGVDGPLLYFPNQLLWTQGWDTAAITYGYQSAGKPFSPLAIADVFNECKRAVSTLLAKRSYARLILMGKSIGASLVTLICQEMTLPHRTRAIYLTPALGPMFNPGFIETTHPALLALGTDDRFFDETAIAELTKNKAFHLVQVEGADHSMNIPGNLAASLEAIQRVTEAVNEFISSADDSPN